MNKRWITMVVLVSGLYLSEMRVVAQLPSRWKVHDMNRPHPPVVVPAAWKLPVPPPSDARVLFDGTDLSQWRNGDGSAAGWKVEGGYMEVATGNGPIVTRQVFGDVQLHVEWAAPATAMGKGQERGNSGVYLMGLYELQVLDSYQNDTYADGQAGAVYGQYPPLFNACLPAGQWQSYEIFFRRPRFDGNGGLIQPARMTVLHNGVLVQDNVELVGPTMWLQPLPYRSHPDKLPLVLQDHESPVRYRNIWIRDLPEFSASGPPPGSSLEPVVALPPEIL
ncbi:MAG: DUF1080 domain-containing protein, partial [Acidobacteriota bacterium]